MKNVFLIASFLTTSLISTLASDSKRGAIVSKGKSVEMISQFYTWNAKGAVDGNTTTKASACNCCAGTRQTNSPWFEIDLGKLFRIAYIVIYGRTDHNDRRQSFDGLNIYAKKHGHHMGDPIFSFKETKYFLDITLATPVITQYITLKQTGYKRMVICELQLLEGDCDDGQFGRLCDKSCNCLGEICNKETGVCPSGICRPGYWGSTCSEECADGQFGIGCNATCGHCLNGKTCDKVHGSCLSCNPGYQGQTCIASCSNGTYGLNCSSYCDNCQDNECDHVTGQCVHGCYPGYSGLICNTSCGYGSYGMNCSQSCGSCANNQTCNNTNGHCGDTGCLEGFIEPLCITPCSNGTYGLNCSSYCANCQDNECDHVRGQCVHGCNPGYSGLLCNTSCGYGSYGMNCTQSCGSCANNQTCNNANGHCDTGCLEGFIEPLCIIRTEELVHDENSNSMLGATVGIPMGLAFVVLAVVVVTIVILRKRRQKRIPGKDADVTEADNTNDKNKDDIPSIPNKDPELVQRTVTFANVAPEEIEYYDFAPRKEDIKIHQIWDYVHDGMADDCKQFYKEFEGFKKGLQCECKCAKESQNKLKNRYKEVYAYDENRVCLKPNDPSEGDYINASFIDGYEKLEKFIASQGPTKEMIDDFWRMIWQQRCTDIVMLTNIFELCVQKCLQYWPMDDESISFGNIAVKLLKEEKSSDFVIRNLEINHKDDETRIVKQYHFTSWPDKTTPDTAWSLVNFWRIVREGTIDGKYPIVVHCSAGIGRTGTFIALDNLYNQGVTEGSIRPAQMVETLRRQRTSMVQTKEQYVYLHEAVSEALLFGTHFVKTDQFEHTYSYLLEKQKGSEKSNLEIQFDLIESSLNDSEPVVNSTPSESNAADDIGKNIPAETEAVYTNVSETLSIKPNNQTNEGTKLHKLYLINNQEKQKLLVKTVPTDSNMTEVFLNLILSSNVTTVLQLQEGAPGLITDMNVGHFDVKISNQTKLENWTRKEFSIMKTEQSGIKVARNIQQYEYFDWKNVENTPRNVLSLLSLLSDIHSKQHQNCDGETILLADSGSSRCGVVCVIQNELARMSKEGNVNIIDSAKNIRHLDRDSVSTLEQYKFCYEAILSTIQQNDIYQNVFL